MFHVRRLSRAGLLALALVAAACSGKVKEKPLSPEEHNLVKFGRLYLEHRKAQGRPPASVDQLKAWAKNQSKEALAKMGIEDLDKVFISPRDNEPYVLVSLPMGMGPVLAHEKTGSGGKRLVLNSQGSVYEADEENFNKMLATNPGGRRR
jgi:hypothetical protein